MVPLDDLFDVRGEAVPGISCSIDWAEINTDSESSNSLVNTAFCYMFGAKMRGVSLIC